MSGQTFIPKLAAWTKEEIVEDLADLLEDNGQESYVLSPDAITDDEAQRFVDAFHSWLLDSIGKDEDSALDAEVDFKIAWIKSIDVFKGVDWSGEGLL